MDRININEVRGIMSFDQYLEQVSQVIKDGSENQLGYTASQLHYSSLNLKRMERILKRLRRISNGEIQLISSRRNLTWLVLTEGWCGDAAQSIPVMNHIAEQVEGLNLLLINRDQHPELMEAFLTNGGRAIPKLIMLDSLDEVLGTWGPRPKFIQDFFMDARMQTDYNADETKYEIQKLYNQDKGQQIFNELTSLLSTIPASEGVS